MSQLDELRQIIVGDNSVQLAELKDRIEDVEQRTQDVAEVLSPAIDKEVRSSNSKLSVALQKPVSDGLKRAIRSEPEEYAEILYPVMAPSIRRAIAQAISGMMQTINRTVESATTVQGLSLRYESMRSGVPYAELALRRSLLYRVEHLYLIHRETGLPIQTLHAQDTRSLDGDAVSAMFSAIQSFVHDSFAADETSQLTDFKVGELNVWLAHGPRTILACVIRGDAPASFKNQLYDTLDLVRTKYGNAIVDFDGNNAAFEDVDGLLSPLLQTELKDEEKPIKKAKKKTPVGAMITYAVAILLVCLIAAQTWFKQNTISTVDHFISKTPGITATDVYWQGDSIIVEGLKDPDARIPWATLNVYGVEKEQLLFNTTPIRSLEPEMEILRFNREFDLPINVILESSGERVMMKGLAPLRWLTQNETRLEQLSTDGRLDTSQLSADLDSVKQELRNRLPLDVVESLNISFQEINNQSLVKISGVVDPIDFALLTSIFASNSWVQLALVSKGSN